MGPLIPVSGAQIVLALLLFGRLSDPVAAEPDVSSIVQHSVTATHMDWTAFPSYSFHEEDRENGGSRTFAVSMILGSPYRRLIAVNDRPLSPSDQEQQQRRMEEAIAKRRVETPSERAERTEEYRKGRERDEAMMTQLTQAFDFTFLRQARLGSYEVYVLKAAPKPGYRPPNVHAEVLTGMKGMMWIDQKTFQWVKVEATVVRPVTIFGFLARVEPGTRFELEKTPVEDGIWFPSRFSMYSNARILSIFPRRQHEVDVFSGYRKTAGATPGTPSSSADN